MVVSDGDSRIYSQTVYQEFVMDLFIYFKDRQFKQRKLSQFSPREREYSLTELKT